MKIRHSRTLFDVVRARKSTIMLRQIITIFLIGAVQPAADADQSPSAARAAIDSARASIVFIESKVTEPSGHQSSESGTGFFVSTSGYVLTANHLVTANPNATVEIALRSPTETRRLKATIMNIPPQCCDLVLLKVSETEGPFKPVDLADSSVVVAGQNVFVLGFTFGQDLSILGGSIASTDAALGHSGASFPFKGSWRIQNPVNGGDSGSPVLDTSGKVIAVVTGGDPTAQGYGLATPISFAFPLLQYIGAPLPSAKALPQPGASLPIDATPRVPAADPHTVTITPAALAPGSPLVTETAVPAIDWSGARTFTISNRSPVPLPNGGSGPWGVLYELDGVFKVDPATALVQFRIDKLELNLNPTSSVAVNTKLLQLGLCHDISPGQWNISPDHPRGPINSRDLALKLEPNKTYTVSNITPFSIPNEDALDLRKAWPCSLLWTAEGGNYPAHALARASIF